MKKILSLFLASFLFINCSNSDDSNEDTNNSEKTSAINFTISQIEYEQNYLMSEVNWIKNDDATTTVNEFEITASPKVKGKTSDILEIFSLTIRTTDNVLVANKTYNLYTKNTYYFLPLNDSSLCYKEVGLWDTDETSGTIKITSFDGKTLKGEFNISNLTNDNGFPLGYCDGTKIVEKRFNITTGTFTAIP